MINDFLCDKDGDLVIENDDLVLGDNTQHHANLVLKLNKGEDKFNPNLGCNLVNYVNGLTPREVISRAIRTELTKVGLRAKTVVINEVIFVENVSYR
jgi:hypothetical protein